jgi:AcrR family transcriptional regulator
MARVALSAEEIEAFRRRAAEAATHLFAEQGYQAVTMRSLAEALGVSAMTPYRYLAGGKSELFALVRAEAFRRFADRLEAALARDGDVLARLRWLKEAYVRFALDEPDAYRMMFELRGDDAELPELTRASARAFACVRRTVAEAVADGELEGDALSLAHLFWASTHGLVSLHLAGRLQSGRSVTQLAAIDHELTGVRPAQTKQHRTRSKR